jgi:hypothetical protein
MNVCTVLDIMSIVNFIPVALYYPRMHGPIAFYACVPMHVDIRVCPLPLPICMNRDDEYIVDVLS